MSDNLVLLGGNNAVSYQGGSGYTQNAYGSVPNTPFASSGIYNFGLPTVQPADTFVYAPSMGVVGVDPNAFAALQNSLVAQENQGLAALENVGNQDFSVIANSFNQWGASLNSLGQGSTQIFQTVANKSAKACTGFFGCLF